MNQHDYYSLVGMQQQPSLWDALFGQQKSYMTWEEIAKATRKHRYDYAIYQIKKQPFYGGRIGKHHR